VNNRDQRVADIRQRVEARRQRLGELRARMAGHDSRDETRSSALIADSSGEMSELLELITAAERELAECHAELKSAYVASDDERERASDFFERVPVAYIVTDLSGVIRDANAAAEHLLQAPRKLLREKTLTSFVDAAERSGFRTRLNQVTGGKDAGEWRWTIRAMDGVECDVIAEVARLSRHANRESLYWVLRQVSRLGRHARVVEQTKPELAKRVSRRGAANGDQFEPSADGQFLAEVSHEIRTPLQAVVGYAEFLQSGVHGALNDAQQRDVERLTENLAHVQSLLNNVVEFARLGRAENELSVTDVPVADALESVASTMRPLCQAKALHLEILPPPAQMLLRADRERLHQILVNLVSNAVKFTSPGGAIRVECSISGSDVLLVVSDNGSGVPAEESDRIFEPFVRLGNSGGLQGAGLGLPICRGLARRMNGDVSLVPEFTGGAAFLLRLPQVPRDAESRSRAQQRAGVSPAKNSQPPERRAS
jgi:PAS domain S-box-containing protein